MGYGHSCYPCYPVRLVALVFSDCSVMALPFPQYAPYSYSSNPTWLKPQPGVGHHACGPSQPSLAEQSAQSAPHQWDALYKARKLASAVGLLGAGLLLHRLPPRLPGDGMKTILPADWKVWARVLLGIDAVHKVNQAFEWHLPPWLSALEAVAIINPLAVGFSANALKQTAVMAPVVAAMVQGASALHPKIAKPVQEQCQLPPQLSSMLTQVGLTVAMGLGAMLAYPRLYKLIASTGIIGKELKEKAAQEASAFASATFATCARGCSPGSFICLSELADISAGFINGFWPDSQPKPQESKPKGVYWG